MKNPHDAKGTLIMTMIDLHTHTLMSDGALLPTELARRAEVAGYSAIAITDHADESNLETLVKQALRVSGELARVRGGIRVLPGVELTHIPPVRIPRMVREARRLGAGIVIGHGETLVEPVAPGTNRAYIKAGVDILAHPGLVTASECALAAKNSVSFEITTRKGHSLSNGHVAAMAKKHGVRLVLNNDAHAPGDLTSEDLAERIVLGAGLTIKNYREMRKNAQQLINRIFG
jgi:histidinol phosphatase-like PHP family hydrolase